MRRFTIVLLFLALAASCVARDETVDELKGRLPNARAEDRPELCVRIAQLEVKTADRLYTEGHVDEARAAVEDVAAYFEKARDAAIESKSHLKNVEIGARKSSEKLADIKRTLAFEDQAPVEKVIHRLEEVRTALLSEMFAGKKKDKR
ncbi:MAG TPA: hypothetical protein VMI10_20850 [Terriglobales bacterium]|nr:hypothetical protein [Terriglobales bacterium]